MAGLSKRRHVDDVHDDRQYLVDECMHFCCHLTRIGLCVTALREHAGCGAIIQSIITVTS